MRFISEKFSSTHRICAKTAYIRDTVCEDISCYSKKDKGNVGIAISGNFILENLNLQYCKDNNIEVVRSSVNYGPYGNVLSIPGTTYTIGFPLKIGLENVLKVFESVFSTIGQTERTKNDILLNCKKLCGCAVTKNMIVVIGSLNTVPEIVSNIYSKRFLDYSNKIAPIERIGGFNDFSNKAITLDEFLVLIKNSLYTVCGLLTEEIKNIDGDTENVSQEYLDKFSSLEWLNKVDYKSLDVTELERIKQERGL